MAKKTIDLVLTSAVVVEGDIKVKDERVTLSAREARNFLQRGKAKLVDEADAAELNSAKELDEMTVAELREIADDAGISGYSDMKKAELIAAIEAETDPVDD